MKYSKIPLSQTVVSLCKQHQIEHIIISPGSRNAPLTIGFTNDDYFKCYSIVDERCAAFFALGIAQQAQKPTALVCTSGSALLNYFPAISEAYYSQIPLVVLSADRPKHLIDIGDGQTIKQNGVYGEHVIYSSNLKLDIKDDYKLAKDEELPIIKSIENKLERFLGIQKDIQSFNETEINTAVETAKGMLGPVHLNIPFDEPLYETTDKPQFQPKISSKVEKELKIDEAELEDCLSTWHAAKRKLVLVGVLQPKSIEAQWIEELANDDSVIVFTETTSNLHHPDFFPGIDKMIAPLDKNGFEALKPDIVMTFGGMVVSKKVKAFLRTYQPKDHWHIDAHRYNDTFFCLTKHIRATPNFFFSKFLPRVTHNIKSDYKRSWLGTRKHRRKMHKTYLETIPFSDFLVFNDVLQSLPRPCHLQVGNSSAIRYTQLFQINKEINVFCNRGTSGIDGCTSTAIGSALVENNPTVLITGDLSFFYDSNALWNNYIPKNFRIILINNEGGGIFRILPGHKNTENFDTYFETKHQLNASQLSAMFGFEYSKAGSRDVLAQELELFYKTSDRPKLLEIFTPARINDDILLDYFKFIK